MSFQQIVLRPMAFHTQVLGPIIITCLGFLLWSMPQIQLEICWLTPITSMPLFCQQPCFTRAVIIVVFRICIYFLWLPQTAYITSPGFMKPNQQGGCFQVGTCWMSLCLMFKVCAVFSNKILPLILKCDQEKMKIPYTVWGDSLVLLEQ